jgi:hypothetical protein
MWDGGAKGQCMRQRLFSISSLLSLLLFVAIVVSWAQSWFVSKTVAHHWIIINGRIYDIWLSLRPAGFKWVGGTFGLSSCTDISAPYWFAVITSGVLPASWAIGKLRKNERNRRARTGLCVACGYNLDGNISGVCPECGTAVVGKLETRA